MTSQVCSDFEKERMLSRVDNLVQNCEQIKALCMDAMVSGTIFECEGPWKKILPSDTECLAGTNISGRIPHCIYCKCISKFCRLGSGEVWKVQSGIARGKTYQIEYLAPPRMLVPRSELREFATQLLGSEEPRNYIAVDSSTRLLLLGWLMEVVSRNSLQILGAYRCRSKVVIIREPSVQLSQVAGSIQENEWKLLLLSVIGLIQALLPYQLVWKTPSPSGLHISLSWFENGNCRSEQPRICLGNGDEISLATGEWRVVPLENKYRPNPESTARMGQLENYIHTLRDGSEVELYSLDSLSFPMFNEVRAAGVPLYCGSFELYCMVVGFYCMRETRNVVLELLGKLWEEMWPGIGHFQVLEERTSLLRNSTVGDRMPSYSEICAVIAGLWLRADLAHLLSKITPQ